MPKFGIPMSEKLREDLTAGLKFDGRVGVKSNRETWQYDVTVRDVAGNEYVHHISYMIADDDIDYAVEETLRHIHHHYDEHDREKKKKERRFLEYDMIRKHLQVYYDLVPDTVYCQHDSRSDYYQIIVEWNGEVEYYSISHTEWQKDKQKALDAISETISRRLEDKVLTDKHNS